jgi:HK97 family phage portal protein
MVFAFRENLTDDQFENLEKQLATEWSGSASAGKNLLLGGVGDKGVDVKPYGFTPAEMDFIEGNRELARRIAFGYGVPPMIIGIPGDNTYSNYKEARLAFWENTVMWYLSYAAGEYNNWFFPEEENLFLGFDLDKVPALAPRREELWERAEKSTHLSINEKREMTGQDSWGPDGDVILVPATMIPLGEEIDTEPSGGGGGDDDEGKTKKGAEAGDNGGNE